MYEGDVSRACGNCQINTKFEPNFNYSAPEAPNKDIDQIINNTTIPSAVKLAFIAKYNVTTIPTAEMLRFRTTPTTTTTTSTTSAPTTEMDNNEVTTTEMDNNEVTTEMDELSTPYFVPTSEDYMTNG